MPNPSGPDDRRAPPPRAPIAPRVSSERALPRLAALLALVAVATVLATVAGVRPTAAAEDDPSGASYLPLYPTGDVYRVQVIGDGLSYGLANGLVEAFRGDARLQVKSEVQELYSLMRGGFADDLESLEETLDKEQPSVAVLVFAPMDRISIRVAGKKYWIDSDEWRTEFRRQVDTMMKALRKRRIAVYWVSFPNVRRSEANEDVQVLNEIVRERALVNGIRYIDAYAGFTDEGGGYSAMGPDLTGKIRVLREPNGINFTVAGNQKLAHFVEREIKRDLIQAKRDRTIPLVGAESEQASVAAAREAQQKPPASKAAAASATGGAGSGPAAGPKPSAGGGALPGAGEQKADSGRISLILTTPTGREESVTVDLLRPAIPASVIALVSKREVADKPTSLGDVLIDRIPGGLVVMSSISSSTDGPETRSRLPPTQTPFFRVMVKGERLPVRPDRADDVAWPRAEPPPLEPEPVPVTPKPSAAGAAAGPATPPRKEPPGRNRRTTDGEPARTR